MSAREKIQTDEFERDVDAYEAINLRLGWVSHRKLAQELDSYNLTVPQFMTMRCILENETGCSMTELAESSYQVSATMTGIVDRLVDRGLVTRERDLRDRRTLRVVLTEEGKQLIEKVNANKRAWLAQFLATLDEEHRQALIQLSKQYLEMMEQTINPESWD